MSPFEPIQVMGNAGGYIRLIAESLLQCNVARMDQAYLALRQDLVTNMLNNDNTIQQLFDQNFKEPPE